MAYGLKYEGDFDSFKPLQSYNLKIFKKGFVGGSTALLLSAVPAVQEWQDDDPQAPIKGCTLKVNLINDGTVQLADFYSEEDDTFLVELRNTQTDQMLFTGYLVQDECSEIQVDFAHEIGLTFTDNLGLLKNITLLQASKKFGTPVSGGFDMGTIPDNYIEIDVPSLNVGIGDTITISGGTGFDGNYTVAEIVQLSPVIIRVVETLPAISFPVYGTLTYYTPIDLTEYLPLSTYIDLCLKATNLNLGINYVSSLEVVGSTNPEWWDGAYLYGTSFMQNETWLSCYDVLQKIMSRFYASCFQSYGLWYVVRWCEYWNNTNFGTGMLFFNDFYNFADTEIETGLLRSIRRPYKQVQEKITYEQIPNTLVNSNLQSLGPLLRVYTSGANIIYEYEEPYWVYHTGNLSNEKFIRIVKYAGAEIERYIVTKVNTDGTFIEFKSNPIFIMQGDLIEYSFEYKITPNFSPHDGWDCFWNVTLANGVQLKYLYINGKWTDHDSLYGAIFSTENSEEWRTITVKADAAPFEGIFEINIATQRSDAGYETSYRNFSLIVTSTVNGEKKIIGHTHTDSQPNKTINNETDKDIFLDDCPSKVISGCMFLDTTNANGTRNATKLWKYQGFSTADEKKLGEWTTNEQLYLRAVPTAAFEGRFLKIKGSTENIEKIISNTACVKLMYNGGFLQNKRFIFGRLSVDYKNATADGTLWEFADTDRQTFNDFLNTELYEFNYLYENN